MKIGITSKFGYGFFANGLNQNIVLLYEVLERIGWEPVFLDFSKIQGDKLISLSHWALKGKTLIEWGDFKKTPEHLDVLLCPAIASNSDIERRVKGKNSSCKIISIKYGNNLISLMTEWFSNEETDIFGMDYGEEFTDGCLISPHYEFAKQFHSITEHCEVGIMPYIWSPKFIQNAAFEQGIKLDYRPVLRPNIAVLEPNINVTKNFYIPFLAICKLLEEAPKIFDKANIYCSSYRVNAESKKKILNYLKKSTPLAVFPDRVSFKGRTKIPFVLNQTNPIILSHQHLNELNYTYLEALNYGYPLVHNSEAIKDYGYYYPEFEAVTAANQISRAIEEHNDNLDKYKEKGLEALNKYSPTNPSVIEETKKAIERFC